MTLYNPSKNNKNTLHLADFTSAFPFLLCKPFQTAKMDSYHAGNAFYVDEDYEAAAEVGRCIGVPRRELFLVADERFTSLISILCFR